MKGPKKTCQETAQGQYKNQTRPGESLLVVGYIGLAGTRAIIEKKRDVLLEQLAESFLDEAMVLAEPDLPELAKKLARMEVSAAWPVGEGGILQAVWELSGDIGMGVRINLRSIPVAQQTIEVCEQMELNPYRLKCENCLLLAVPGPGELLEWLSRQGWPAEVIGYTKKGVAREVFHGGETGYLERPKADELHKII